MIARNDVTGVILCGGRARRMDGVEKALQAIAGAPLVQHVRERLAPQVGKLVLSANRHHLQYAQWGDTVVSDAIPDGGPLSGLCAALDQVTTPWVFCCPGDAPNLDTSLVMRLSQALDEQPGDLAFPFDGERDQHLFLLMRSSLRSALELYLESGERSVHGFVATCDHLVVDASDVADSFANLNTAQEFAALEARMSSHSQPIVEHL